SAQPWSSELTGDESLVRRPMGRIIDPLEAMGAKVVSNDGYPPLVFSAPSKLTGIHYHS
ncbi:MAG: 3-phosphoshikimate 1-carboxyvinyltransferase, partial [Nitrospinaceae bacterium]|nr:3-phosphoshikimate 1-carboxyvinyltransferase [Nitrospinaceae bacterium]